MPAPEYYQGLITQGWNPEYVAQIQAAGLDANQAHQQAMAAHQGLLAPASMPMGSPETPDLVTGTGPGTAMQEQMSVAMGRMPGQSVYWSAQDQRWKPVPDGPEQRPNWAGAGVGFQPQSQAAVAEATAPPAPPAAPVGPEYDFSGIPSMQEGFGDPYVAGSTYYKVIGPDGKLTYTNVPQTVATGLGGPVDIVEMATQQGATLKGKGGSAEVMIGGRSLPGPDASRAEIEALSYDDQIRWAERMQFARQKQQRAIEDKLRDYSLQEATLPWDVRMKREAEKQAALYNYVSQMPEFQGLTDKIIDEKIEQLKMAEPERMKDPEKIQQAIAAIRPIAEKEAQARIQERLMMIMMGSSSVAGRYAGNPMMAMLMGGMGMGTGGP